MKVVILAGGTGTRISEETIVKPKPMVEIGGKPILWHIMKTYSHYGFNDFIICLGYKGYLIKEYFINYFYHQSDLTIDMKNNSIDVHSNSSEHWKVTLIDTGAETMTGGRIKRIKDYTENQPFMLTYGDGLSNIDYNKLLENHKKAKKFATLSAIQPIGRFGALELDDNNFVKSFREKPKGDGAWVNGGFFVLEQEIFNFIENDSTVWEKTPIEKLAEANQLNSYKHDGFWKPMDTLRDKNELDSIWASGNADWKTWDK